MSGQPPPTCTNSKFYFSTLQHHNGGVLMRVSSPRNFQVARNPPGTELPVCRCPACLSTGAVHETYWYVRCVRSFAMTAVWVGSQTCLVTSDALMMHNFDSNSANYSNSPYDGDLPAQSDSCKRRRTCQTHVNDRQLSDARCKTRGSKPRSPTHPPCSSSLPQNPSYQR